MYQRTPSGTDEKWRTHECSNIETDRWTRDNCFMSARVSAVTDWQWHTSTPTPPPCIISQQQVSRCIKIRSLQSIATRDSSIGPHYGIARRPSVRPFVSSVYGLLTRNQKGVEKRKSVRTCPSIGAAGILANFQLNETPKATKNDADFLAYMFIAAGGFRAGRPPAHALDAVQWPRTAEYMSSRSLAASMLILLLNGFLSSTRAWWLNSVTVRTLDLRSRGRGSNSRSGHYQVVTTWMGDCRWTGKPSRYITNTKVNSAFHPSGVGKSSTGLHGWG